MGIAFAVILTLFGISLLLTANAFVFASSSPQDFGPGGTISGIVVAPGGAVVDWSQIYAKNGNQTYEAFSGFSGFYLMHVPAGTYNVTVYDFYNPVYWAPSVNATITDGSSLTVNFYLQPHAPPAAVPEFQPDLTAVLMMVSIAAACILAKRSGRLFVPH